MQTSLRTRVGLYERERKRGREKEREREWERERKKGRQGGKKIDGKVNMDR